MKGEESTQIISKLNLSCAGSKPASTEGSMTALSKQYGYSLEDPLLRDPRHNSSNSQREVKV